MDESSDAQLLSDYAERGSESAFRELVRRHADVVYASALRQVGSPELARDVAQSVFMDLARKAAALAMTFEERASLLGWLYRSTRFAALTLMRNERRRQLNERRMAMDQLHSTPDEAPDWEQVGPILDEAMADLSDADREAILLRFFKKLDFRAVGEALSVSDDSAQKRVSRALERLRLYLTKRGVTTTALALSAALASHAAPVAPAGLAAALATSVLTGAAVQTVSTLTATKAIAMTTIQKTVLAAALAAAVGAGVYQTRQVARLRADVQEFNDAQAPLSAQVRQLNADADGATSRIAALREENDQLRQQLGELPRLRGELSRLRAENRAASSSPGDTTQAAAQAWLDRVNLLKARLDQMPQAKIPELQLATEQDWLDAAKGELNTDTDYRRSLSLLRNALENKFVALLQPALRSYLDANGGKFPANTLELQSYFSSPIDPLILQHWQVAPASDLPSLGMGGDWIITEASVVDEAYDQRRAVGPHGSGTSFSAEPQADIILHPALKAFLAANDGALPSDPSQLQPYVDTASQRSALQHLLGRFSGMSNEEKDQLLQKMQIGK